MHNLVVFSSEPFVTSTLLAVLTLLPSCIIQGQEIHRQFIQGATNEELTLVCYQFPYECNWKL